MSKISKKDLKILIENSLIRAISKAKNLDANNQLISDKVFSIIGYILKKDEEFLASFFQEIFLDLSKNLSSYENIVDEKYLKSVDDMKEFLIKNFIETPNNRWLIPALIKDGEIVALNEKFKNKLLIPINEGRRSPFSFADQKASSKNLYLSDIADDNYSHLGLFGASNISGGIDLKNDSAITGGSTMIPFYNLYEFLRSFSPLAENIDFSFLTEEDFLVLQEVEQFYLSNLSTENHQKEHIVDASFKQIVIPVDDDFISVSPLMITDLKGVIGNKINDLNQTYVKQKDKVGAKNINSTTSQESASNVQNFTSLPKEFKEKVLVSSAPTFSISKAIENNNIESLIDFEDNTLLKEIFYVYSNNHIQLRKHLQNISHFLNNKHSDAIQKKVFTNTVTSMYKIVFDSLNVKDNFSYEEISYKLSNEFTSFINIMLKQFDSTGKSGEYLSSENQKIIIEITRGVEL